MQPRIRLQRRRQPAYRERPVRGRHQQLRDRVPVWEGLTPTPDRGFLKKLRRFDPSLSVEFNRSLGKFCIMQEGRISGRTLAMVVQGGENGRPFRQPDERDLGRLRAVDMHNDRMRKRMIDERERELREQPRKEMVEAQTEFQEASRDDKHQIKRAYRIMTNDGKAAPHVRTVAPRPRGKVFK